ncbi:MAG: hypothetical protein GEU79_13840 [Acidimicrobiia bacterium]|nr:hypothetical protein [Acidimicrobiia bacterium]
MGAIEQLTNRLTKAVERFDDAADRAKAAGETVKEVAPTADDLKDEHKQPDSEQYAQNIVYADAGDRFSIVSLVWLPEQSTPIHDHHCWCVVYVVQGLEGEQLFSLHRGGEEEWLSVKSQATNEPGACSVLVPPTENIHAVKNAGDDVAISLHLYGDNYSRIGTSINRIFDMPIRAPDHHPEGREVSWREQASTSGGLRRPDPQRLP